jgi:hypothetical protein
MKASKIILYIIFCVMLSKHIFAQEKLPYSIINKMVTQTDMFILNHSTQFAHVDLPKGKYQQFFGYIKDSAVVAIPNAQNPIYYKWYLKDGSEINGDLFYKDNKAYMLFKIDGKTYINYFLPEGLQQLKNIFKF